MKIRSFICISMLCLTVLCIPQKAIGEEKVSAATSQTATDEYFNTRSILERLIDGTDSSSYSRSQWIHTANRFQELYDKNPNWNLRVASLYHVARTYENMARQYGTEDDASQAVKTYKLVTEQFPNHPLADDALYCVARILSSSNTDEAQSVRIRILKEYPNGDMAPRVRTEYNISESALKSTPQQNSSKSQLQPETPSGQSTTSQDDSSRKTALEQKNAPESKNTLPQSKTAEHERALSSENASKDIQNQPDENASTSLITDYFSTLGILEQLLDGTEPTVNSRTPWLNVAKHFEELCDNNPTWHLRAASLYRVARTYEGMAHQFGSTDDASNAIAVYTSVPTRFPESPLVDDALFCAARVHFRVNKNNEQARKLLKQILNTYPKSDMAQRIHEALGTSSDILSVFKNENAITSSASKTIRKDLTSDEASTLAGKAFEDKVFEVVSDSAPTKKAAQPATKTVPPATQKAQPAEKTVQPATQKAQPATKKESVPLPASSAAHNEAQEIDNDDEEAEAPKNLHESRPVKTSVLEQVNVSLQKDDAQIVVSTSPQTEWIARSYRANSNKNAYPCIILELKNTLIRPDTIRSSKGSGILHSVQISEGKNKTASVILNFTKICRFLAYQGKEKENIILKVSSRDDVLQNGKDLGGTIYSQKLKAPKKTEVPKSAVQAKQSSSVQKASVQKEQKKVKAQKQTQKPKNTNEKQKKADSPKTSSQNAISDNVANQLGLTAHTIIIDAGHGGKDPGATGNGITEKKVNLVICQSLAKKLKKKGFAIHSTRNDDSHVELQKRPQFAKASKGDMFISIHINSNEDKSVSGFETYYLNFAKSDDSARVAAVENSVSSYRLGDMDPMVAQLVLEARTKESETLADCIQKETLLTLKSRKYGTHDGGMRSAPFHVLMGSGMPSILIEVGYCSNKKEAKLLTNSSYINALTDGIVKGIVRYTNSLGKK